jgi:hypothetical protein
MAKFVVDLFLDGYDSEKEMIDACKEFIYDSCNMTASSVKVQDFQEYVKNICPQCLYGDHSLHDISAYKLGCQYQDSEKPCECNFDHEGW